MQEHGSRGDKRVEGDSAQPTIFLRPAEGPDKHMQKRRRNLSYHQHAAPMPAGQRHQMDDEDVSKSAGTFQMGVQSPEPAQDAPILGCGIAAAAGVPMRNSSQGQMPHAPAFKASSGPTLSLFSDSSNIYVMHRDTATLSPPSASG
ncbi:hypothetical protein K490DRAFT_54364 [Saccharata proteae CBS 121410]|uniref:Uncharacterized protein n=1 Tax=Saccharata proteae CBS 121410 TaxID=1314787 RepID=A0A9P4LWU7_9PEZI|nr:hypothetical protein K490DRAFT_54364 [Saccharata proteae CBS 121410]